MYATGKASQIKDLFLALIIRSRLLCIVLYVYKCMFMAQRK